MSRSLALVVCAAPVAHRAPVSPPRWSTTAGRWPSSRRRRVKDGSLIDGSRRSPAQYRCDYRRPDEPKRDGDPGRRPRGGRAPVGHPWPPCSSWWRTQPWPVMKRKDP